MKTYTVMHAGISLCYWLDKGCWTDGPQISCNLQRINMWPVGSCPATTPSLAPIAIEVQGSDFPSLFWLLLPAPCPWEWGSTVREGSGRDHVAYVARKGAGLPMLCVWWKGGAAIWAAWENLCSPHCCMAWGSVVLTPPPLRPTSQKLDNPGLGCGLISYGKQQKTQCLRNFIFYGTKC